MSDLPVYLTCVSVSIKISVSSVLSVLSIKKTGANDLQYVYLFPLSYNIAMSVKHTSCGGEHL